MPLWIRIVALVLLLISWGAVLELSKACQKAADKEAKGLFGEGTLIAFLFSLAMCWILLRG